MWTTNFSSGRSHTKSFEELLCSPSLMSGLQQLSICFLAVDILLCIAAFAGNSLILVALYKESSLHPPSKLLYRCLATTDLLVGLVNHPLRALYWMSVFQEHWSLCGYVREAAYITVYVLFLCIGHKRGQTSRPVVGTEIQANCNFEAHVYYCNYLLGFKLVASLGNFFHHRIIFLYIYLVISFCLVISVALYTKIFCTLRYHQAQVRMQTFYVHVFSS